MRDRSYRVCERDGRLGSRSEGRRDEKDCHGAEGGHEDRGAGWLVAKRDVFWFSCYFCITVCVASFSSSSLIGNSLSVSSLSGSSLSGSSFSGRSLSVSSLSGSSLSVSSLGLSGLLILTCLISSRSLGLGLDLTRTYLYIFLQREGLGFEIDGLGAEGEHGEGEGDLGKHIVDVVSFDSFLENDL